MANEETGSPVWIILLGVGALVVCCAGPLLAAGGMVTLLWLAAALEAQRASLVAASIALFAAGLYASRRAGAACCEPAGPSRATFRSRHLAVVLWALGATVLLVAVLVSTAGTAGR